MNEARCVTAGFIFLRCGTTPKAFIVELAQSFERVAQPYPSLAVPLRSKTTKLGGASAIQASLIAFGLHEFCRQNYNQTAKRMEISIILTVALAAALIVVVLALVAIIIYQRWRLSDKNAAISKFINENEQLRLKMQRTGIV